MRRRYHPDVDDADELYAEDHGKRHRDGDPDCECRGCMDDDESDDDDE